MVAFGCSSRMLSFHRLDVYRWARILDARGWVRWWQYTWLCPKPPTVAVAVYVNVYVNVLIRNPG